MAANRKALTILEHVKDILRKHGHAEDSAAMLRLTDAEVLLQDSENGDATIDAGEIRRTVRPGTPTPFELPTQGVVEAFEHWASLNKLPRAKNAAGVYGNVETRAAWWSWKAVSSTLNPRPTDETLSVAARDVLAERTRQVLLEGWTPEHDDEHDGGEMAVAAACYALVAGVADPHRDALRLFGPLFSAATTPLEQMWPWDAGWWKPKDRRRDLVRAGALVIAEIERLDRAGRRREDGL